MNLFVPKELIEELVFPFLQDLREHVGYPTVVIDFSSLRYSRPFGMLTFASGFRDFVKHRKHLGFETHHAGIDFTISAHSYLGHIGFFRFVGITVGRNLGEASGSTTYMPITNITRRELQRVEDIHIGQAINHRSEQLAQIVLSTNKLKLGHPVAYCFRETIRNVFEHSECNLAIVCAQAWWDNSLEIAIIDRGCGIRGSLAEKFISDDDFLTIRHSLNPGISRVDVTTPNDDEWSNSGFGLYVLSELCKKTGHILICSGTAGLYAKGNTVIKRPYVFSGTAVKLSMTKPKDINVGELIDSIIAEGERIAAETIGPVRASKSTRSISSRRDSENPF